MDQTKKLYRSKKNRIIGGVCGGLAEYFNQPDCIVVIEWADKVKDLLPSSALLINFKEGAEDNQKIIEMT